MLINCVAPAPSVFQWVFIVVKYIVLPVLLLNGGFSKLVSQYCFLCVILILLFNLAFQNKTNIVQIITKRSKIGLVSFQSISKR